MKSFRFLRSKGKVSNIYLVLELSYTDIFRLLLGKEITILDSTLTGEQVILRQRQAYEAFNLTAKSAD
jgi:hypothetical protein